MSQIVSTTLGRFRAWRDSSGGRGFLFECPECGEWLPMSEEHLNGTLAPIHSVKSGDRFCTYAKKEVYGATLVSTMQAKLLMAVDGEDVKPYDTDYASLVLGE